MIVYTYVLCNVKKMIFDLLLFLKLSADECNSTVSKSILSS